VLNELANTNMYDQIKSSEVIITKAAFGFKVACCLVGHLYQERNKII